ncbi:MAG: hypothetical protein OHK0057_20460 [Thermoflexibacter sp.]
MIEMETLVEIPQALIYEVIDGKPIYYKNYKKVLNEGLKIQDIIGCSSLQAIFFSIIMHFLYKTIDERDYVITGNEAGLHIDKNHNLAADILIYSTAVLKMHPIGKKCFDFPPKIIIEIDVQAENEKDETFELDTDYVHIKTQKLLDSGVEKVIWVFTESKQIIVATQEKPWLTYGWESTISLFDNYELNLAKLIKESELL